MSTENGICSVCRNVEGKLISCGRCPRMYHFQCAALEEPPQGKWYCRLCDENLQVDSLGEQNPKQITGRCTWDSENQHACALCGNDNFCKSEFGPRTAIICDQCEKEYHVACLKDYNMDDLQAIPKEDWFCSHGCKSVNNALSDLVKRCDQNLPTNLEEVTGNNLDIKWRVLNANKNNLRRMHSLFAEAVSVFHENFDSIMYEGTEQDLIPHLVYSRKLRKTEFKGMHCVVLRVNSTIVSAAVFRVFSEQVAEIPLVSTKKDFLGKGYFRCLYLCIETWLRNHGVHILFVPASTSTRSMWIQKFGFDTVPAKLEVVQILYPLMHFNETSMLLKLLRQPST